MAHYVELLIRASERAAVVARTFIVESSEDSLLISEKVEGDANSRFEKDFKTIADVVAQEAAKRELRFRQPRLAGEREFRAEEKPEINGLRIEILDTRDETTELLSNLLPPATARRLAEAAHCTLDLDMEDYNVPAELPDIPIEDLHIWMDPIDGTAEFITGVKGNAAAGHGLPCVTILIGAYQHRTGEPSIGVINQPFFKNGKSRIIWGYNYEGISAYGGFVPNPNPPKVILMSESEKPLLVEKFKKSGWKVQFLPGCGNKMLQVALGEATGYVCSNPTTYYWDTCGPNAIIQALGGNILTVRDPSDIMYNIAHGGKPSMYSNFKGIVVFTNESEYKEIQKIIDM